MTDVVKMAIEIGSDEAISFLENACRNWSRVPKLSKDDVGDVARALTGIVRKYQPVALEQAGEPVAAVRLEAVAAPGIVCPTCEGEEPACTICGGIGRILPLPTLQRLGQEFDAGEGLAKRVAETMDEDGGCWSACSGCQESVDGCVSARDYPYSPIFKCQPGSGCRECGGIGVTWMDGAFLAGYDEALSVPPQSRVAADPVGLREAMRQERNEAIMALTAKFGPILKAAFPNEHSRTRFDVANALAEVALATPSQPDPQSRGQAFDGEGEGFTIGDPVEKFTGEAIWHGVIVASYLTSKGKRRYVVEVEPQGFQMIAVPSQLRALSEAREAGE